MGRVILFGAGASAFGPGILPKNPPLGGKDLFAELRTNYPRTWGSLGHLSSKFAKDLEAGMDIVWQQYSTIITPLMQDMGRYFLSFRTGGSGVDLYSRLLTTLDKARKLNDTTFATLDYECIFDTAINGLGFSNIELLKPHGSCNYWQSGVQGTAGISFTAGVSFEGPVEVCATPNDVLSRMQQYAANYPTVVIYMPSKRTQMGQSTLERIQSELADRIANSDTVAVIGIKPNPRDNHIWDPLAPMKGRLYYIGDQQAFEEWSLVYRKNGYSEWVHSTFEDGIDKLVRLL